MSELDRNNPFGESTKHRRLVLPAAVLAGVAAVALAVGVSNNTNEKTVPECDSSAQIAEIKQRMEDRKPFRADVLTSKNQGNYLKAFDVVDDSSISTRFTIDPIVVTCGAKVVSYVGIFDANNTGSGDIEMGTPDIVISQTKPSDALLQEMSWDGLPTNDNVNDSDKAMIEKRVIQYSTHAGVGFTTSDIVGTAGAGFIDIERQQAVALMP